jgi:outer membrane protein assembly factor BamD
MRDILRIVALAVLILPPAFGVGCGGRASLSNLSADKLFTLGKEKYDDGKYRTAVEYFQAIVYDYPGESFVDTAQYYLALSYFSNEDYELARVEFNRLMTYYPSSVYADHAQFLRSVCLYEATPKHYGLDQSPLYEAIRQFEDFLIDNPESELVPDAQAYLKKARTRLAKKDFRAGLTYFRIRALEAAKIYFQKVVDDYTDTEFGAKALYYLAEAEMELKNYGEASRMFENFTLVYPEHDWVNKAREKAAQAAFENAQSAFENGNPAEAKSRFEEFIRRFPGSERVEEASAYLEEIGETPLNVSPTEQSGEA